MSDWRHIADRASQAIAAAGEPHADAEITLNGYEAVVLLAAAARAVRTTPPAGAELEAELAAAMARLSAWLENPPQTP
jgi:hypothetical protein